MRIIVDHVAGSRRGQRQEFGDAERLRFGRHPDNEVSFDAHRDLDASSRHAEVRRAGAGYALEDVGSSNGTFVDGERVTELELAPRGTYLVEFGDGGPKVRIWIGDLEDEAPAPPPLGRGGVGGALSEAARRVRSSFRHASWPVRIGILALAALLIAGAIALFLAMRENGG